MTVHVDIPDAVRDVLAEHGRDLGLAAREAILVELYRRGAVTHRQLADFLGLDRFETERLLAKLNVFEGTPTLQQTAADCAAVERILNSGR